MSFLNCRNKKVQLDLSQEPLLQKQLKQLVEDAVQSKMQWFLDEMKKIVPTKTDKLYTYKQAGQILQRNRTTVYRYIKDKKLTSNFNRIKASELERFMSSQEYMLKKKRTIQRH